MKRYNRQAISPRRRRARKLNPDPPSTIEELERLHKTPEYRGYIARMREAEAKRREEAQEGFRRAVGKVYVETLCRSISQLMGE